MNRVDRTSVEKLMRYIQELQDAKLRPHDEIKLNELRAHLQRVGFSGPVSKSGSVRGFSHELLRSNPMLHGGQFTVHVVHGSKVEKIRIRDFKRYVLPHVQSVLNELENRKLIDEVQDV